MKTNFFKENNRDLENQKDKTVEDFDDVLNQIYAALTFKEGKADIINVISFKRT